MSFDDINKILMFLVTAGGLIKLSIEGVRGIKKHEILTKY